MTTISDWDGKVIPETTVACANCRFFVYKDRRRGGECRRHAPRPTRPLDEMKAEAYAIVAWSTQSDENYNTEPSEALLTTWWPTVCNNEFCGEFQDKLRYPAMVIMEQMGQHSTSPPEQTNNILQAG